MPEDFNICFIYKNSYFYNMTNIFLFLCFLWIVSGKCSSCEESFPRECDFIVVGAGAAGATIAGRLSEMPDMTVCLLEAGISDQQQPIATAIETPRLWSTLIPSIITWNYTLVPQQGLNGREPFNGMGKTLGGSTAHNAMAYFRGFKADYDNWAASGSPGWRYADVLPSFLKSEDNRIPELRNSSLHNVGGPLTVSQSTITPNSQLYKLLSRSADAISIPTGECNRQTPFGLCIHQWTIQSGQRESSSTAFLRQNLGRKNLHVLTEAMVSKILISRRNKRAFGIRFLKDGRTRYIRARREIIVSAGSLESPKLLQLSGIGPESLLRKLRIRPFKFLPVGQNLHDHVVYTLEILADIDTPTLKTLTSPKVLAEYIFQRKGLIAEPEGTLNIFFDIKPQRRFNRPEAQVIFFGKRLAETISGESVRTGILPENITQRSRNGTGVILLLSQPKSRGTLKPRSKNSEDLPLINPRLFDNEDDIQVMIKGIRKLQQLVKSRPMREARAEIRLDGPLPQQCFMYADNSNKQWECILRDKVTPGLHPVSTCKMGEKSDTSAVVDTRLRVKGIKGLRVADASIIPEIPSSNIMAAVIMIGERAADFIKDDLRKKRRY